jgi:tRNA(His) guanylyltransferase
MLEKGLNWNDLEVKYKRGTYIKRVVTSKPFTKEELDKLPPRHNAHKNPDLIITRSIITEIEYPIFNKITNKEDVIFFDAEPIINKIENENNY